MVGTLQKQFAFVVMFESKNLHNKIAKSRLSTSLLRMPDMLKCKRVLSRVRGQKHGHHVCLSLSRGPLIFWGKTCQNFDTYLHYLCKT
jgi:hypothetical protein